MSNYQQATRYGGRSFSEEIVATLALPGMTPGGADYGPDDEGYTHWEEIHWRDDEEEPLGIEYNLALDAHRLVTLPRSPLFNGCGYTSWGFRATQTYSRDLRTERTHPTRSIGAVADSMRAEMHIAPPWRAMLVQAPDNDPNLENVSPPSYYHRGDSLFCVGAKNITSGKTTIELVRARVYVIEQIDDHLSQEARYRFRGPHVPPVAVPFTVTTAAGDLDLVCVWHVSEFESTLPLYYVPHVYLADIDDSSYLDECPLRNAAIDEQRYRDGKLRVDIGNCLLEYDRAYQTTGNAYDLGYAQRERPIGLPYDNRSSDDRQAVVEVCSLADWNNETWVRSWTVYITRGASYLVGGSNDIVATLPGASFGRKNIGNLDGNPDTIVYTLSTTVGAINPDPDDLIDDLRITLVYIDDDDGLPHVWYSGWSHNANFLWICADHEQPCPISSLPAAGIDGSFARRGRWWPGENSPARPWEDNTSSITITVAGDKQSADIDVVSDWGCTEADEYFYYESKLIIIDDRGQRIAPPKTLSGYWENHPSYPTTSRPITQSTWTVDTSHAPAWIIAFVEITVIGQPYRRIIKKYATVGSP